MRGGGLRSQLFRAIGLVVLICVALTIGLGVVLTRRAVEKATLKDLSHQVDLIAPNLRHATAPQTALQELTPYFNNQHELALTQRKILPAHARVHRSVDASSI